MPKVYAIDGITPVVHPSAFVHPSAVLIGDVIVGARAYIGPCACLRGDFGRIVVEEGANIQDTCMLHGFPGKDTVVGAEATIGHGAVIHACRLEEFCLVGMGAIVLDGAVVSRYGFVGAGAVVSPGKTVGEAELWLGNPARFVRKLNDREIEQLQYSAQHYIRLKDEYLRMAQGNAPDC